MGYFAFLQQRIKENTDDNDDECIRSRDVVVNNLIISDNAKSHMPTTYQYKTSSPPMKDYNDNDNDNDNDEGGDDQIQKLLQSPPPLRMCRRIDFLISLSNRGIKSNKVSSSTLQRHDSGSTATHSSDHHHVVAAAVDDINITGTSRKSVSERDIRSHRNSIHLYFNQRGGGTMMSDRNISTNSNASCSEAAATTRKRFKFITNSHSDSAKDKTKSVSFFSLQLLKRNDNTPIQPVRLESDENKLNESSTVAVATAAAAATAAATATATVTATTVKGNNNNNNIASFPSFSSSFLLGTTGSYNNHITTDTAPKKPEREVSDLD